MNNVPPMERVVPDVSRTPKKEMTRRASSGLVAGHYSRFGCFSYWFRHLSLFCCLPGKFPYDRDITFYRCVCYNLFPRRYLANPMCKFFKQPPDPIEAEEPDFSN